MHSAPHFVEEALAGGASGYVLKHNAFDEVIRAIYAVHRGHVFVTSEVTGALVESWRAKREEEVSAFNLLTERERDVLQLLAEGLSTHEIGERLHLSIKTVGTHRQHIMEKTGIRSIAGLTKYAVAEGLTELESLE
jgi:DNA-binding NarL/FixJ family response regulator